MLRVLVGDAPLLLLLFTVLCAGTVMISLVVAITREFVVVVSHIQRIGCQPDKTTRYFIRWPIPHVGLLNRGKKKKKARQRFWVTVEKFRTCNTQPIIFAKMTLDPSAPSGSGSTFGLSPVVSAMLSGVMGVCVVCVAPCVLLAPRCV